MLPALLAVLSGVALLLVNAGRSPATTLLEETVEQTYQIDPQSKVSVENTDGAIRVYGSDSNELKIQAIKRSYSAERLKQISVSISVQPGNISIVTKYPPNPKWSFSDRSGTVDYVLLVPWECDISRLALTNGEVLVEGMRGHKVQASLSNGRLFGHNCFADLDIAVGNGGLDVAYDWWEDHKFSVAAQIVNGNARAFFPGEAEFRLLAESVNGHVASDFIEKEHRQKGGVRKIDMVIGSTARAEVKLRAVNGSIKVAEVNP